NTGVAHGEVQLHIGWIRSAARLGHHRHHNLSPLRKLNGVPDQVHQDLTNPQSVSENYLRHGAIDIADQFKTLLMSAQGECADRFFDVLPGVELDEVQIEHTCLDL